MFTSDLCLVLENAEFSSLDGPVPLDMDISTEEYDYLSDSDLEDEDEDEDEPTPFQSGSDNDIETELEPATPETDTTAVSRRLFPLFSLHRSDHSTLQQPAEDATAAINDKTYVGTETPDPDTGRQGKIIIVPDVAYATYVYIYSQQEISSFELTACVRCCSTFTPARSPLPH